MKVRVEEISAIERKVVVEVAVEDVNRALAGQYKRIARTARVRGFRPGKVPKGLVKRMFFAEAQNGASQELIQGRIVDAFKEAAVEPLNMPDIEREPLVEGEPFTFSLFCQVRPEFALVGLGDIRVERRDVEPGEDAIAAELEKLREQHAELVPVEDRASDIGDILTIDYVGQVAGDEEPFPGGTGTDQEVTLGSGSLVPGFEDQLQGVAEGAEVVVEINFPEDYVEHLAGKAATFTVTVKAVRTKVLPDLDEDFAVDLEFEDMGALRASVYDRLSSALLEEEEGRVREEILNALMAANPVDVPAVLVDQAAERLRRQLGMHLAMGGLDREHLGRALDEQGPYIQERAQELAHRDMLLEAVAIRAELTVSDSQLDERIGEIAERTGQPKAKVRATLQDDRMEGLRLEMLQQQAFEWLEARATGEVPMEMEEEAAPEAAPEGDEAPEATENSETEGEGLADAPDSATVDGTSGDDSGQVPEAPADTVEPEAPADAEKQEDE